MKHLLAVLLLCLIAVTLGQAQPAKVLEKPPLSSSTIAPDAHVFGIPFGVSEADLILKCGPPSGRLALTKNRSCLIYGRTFAFIFKDGKLSGFRGVNSVVEWKLSRMIEPRMLFKGDDWQLDNGIKLDDTMAKLKQIVGGALKGEEYSVRYRTKHALVEIGMASIEGAGEGDDAYVVHDISVTRD